MLNELEHIFQLHYKQKFMSDADFFLSTWNLGSINFKYLQDFAVIQIYHPSFLDRKVSSPGKELQKRKRLEERSNRSAKKCRKEIVDSLLKAAQSCPEVATSSGSATSSAATLTETGVQTQPDAGIQVILQFEGEEILLPDEKLD